MTFSFSIKYKVREISKSDTSNKRRFRVGGTFTNTESTTGGDIHPGLRTIDTFFPSVNAASTNNYGSLTSAGSGITLVVDAGIDGFFEAVGLE